MNKVFPVISILLLIAAGYELLKINTLTEENNNLKEQVVKAAKNGCDVCKDSTSYPAFNYLEVKTIKDMAKLYQGPLNLRRLVTQSNGNNVDDANSIWFPLDALKQFIWEIQKDTCGKACDGLPLELGVRIYYARYPKVDSVDVSGKEVYPDLNNIVSSEYENMHTAFLIPTYDSSGYQKDFDPRYFDPKNRCSFTTINPDAWPAAKRILVLAPSNYTAKNHGGLCPPLTNCKGSAF